MVDLQPEHLQTLYGRLLTDGKSPATVRLAHAVLHRALSRALSWGKVARNVADASMVDLPRLPHREAAHLDARKARLVLDAAHGDRLESLWALASLLGCAAASCSPSGGMPSILTARWSKSATRSSPTGASPSRSPPARAVPYLSARRLSPPSAPTSVARSPSGWRRDQWQEPRLAVAGSKVTLDGGLVFTTPLGRPLPITPMVKAWAALLRRAGLPVIPFHGTRRTAASLLADAGGRPTVAQARLGCGSPRHERRAARGLHVDVDHTQRRGAQA